MRAWLIALLLTATPCIATGQTIAPPEFAEMRAVEGEPVWAVAPSHEEIRRRHPPRAAERDQRGQVDLMCRVRDREGLLGCAIISEEPAGWGFGLAALRVSDLYRIAPVLNGEPTLGRSVPLHVDFTDPPTIQHVEYCMCWAIVTLEPRNPHPAGVSDHN